MEKLSTNKRIGESRRSFLPVQIALAFMVLFISLRASGETLFVAKDDPTCAGQFPCFGAIQLAIDAAADGDRVHVLPGVYFENLQIVSKTVALIAVSGPENTVVDGQRFASVVRIWEGADAIIDGFTIRNGGGISTNNDNGFGIFVGGFTSSRALIRNNAILNNWSVDMGSDLPSGGGGIGADAGSVGFNMELEIYGNLIADNFRGILVDVPSSEDTGFVRITNNIVAYNSVNPGDPSGGGMLFLTCCAFDDLGQLTIQVTHNTVYGNSAVYGGGIAANASNLSLASNILFANVGDQDGDDLYLVQAGLDAEVSYNIIGDGQFVGVAGNVAADPMLRNPAGGDFLPTTGSVAIDAIPFGTNGCGAEVDSDMRGTERPQGAGCDIGALEVLDYVLVDVDIRPGGTVNPVNPRSRGVIRVAVLGSAEFDPSSIDPQTVAFGAGGALAVQHPYLDDVNHDEHVDLMFVFRTSDAGIACGETQGVLSGQLLDGTPIRGSDLLKTTGCN